MKPDAFLPPSMSLKQPPLPKKVLRRAQEEASTYTLSTFRNYKYNRKNKSNNKKFAVVTWDGKKGEVRSTELVSPTLVALSANLKNQIGNEQFDSLGDLAYACLVDTYVLNRSVGIDNVKAISKVLPSVADYVKSMRVDLGKIRAKVNKGIVDFDAAQEKRFTEVSAFIDKLESTGCSNFVELALKEEDVPTFPWLEEPEDALQPLPGSLASELSDDDGKMLTTHAKDVLGQFKRTTATARDKDQGDAGKGTTVGDEGCECIHCGKKFFSGNEVYMKKHFERLSGHIEKCKECPEDTKDATRPKGWKAKNGNEHVKINNEYSRSDIMDVWAKLAGEKVPTDSFIEDYIKDIVADFEEELAARDFVVDKNKKHIPMSELLKQDKVVKFIKKIYSWLCMTDNERADVTLKDIQDEAMKCGVNLQDIWPDLEGKYNHYVKGRKKSDTSHSAKGEFMKTAVIKSSRILQKHCADCDVELAKFISTGLEEAFRGCDNDHMFDNIRRALNDDERTKRNNVSAMASFSLLKILRELLYTAITCFLCHDRRAGKECANIKHPNTTDKCEKEYPKIEKIVPLSKVISGGADGELDEMTDGSAITATIEEMIKKGTDKYTYEEAKRTYEASSGGMKLEDNSIWTKPDYDSASQPQRTSYLKKTFDDTLKRKAGCCACCGLSIRNLPVKVFQGFDLHHINELLKRYDPSDMLNYSIQNKVREFRETVLLCKACHSSVTHDMDSLKEFMAMLRREGVIDKDGNIIH